MVSFFRKGNFDLNDYLRSGRSIEFDEERFTAIHQENNRQTSRELAEKNHRGIKKLSGR